jgi:hypothetical protein
MADLTADLEHASSHLQAVWGNELLLLQRDLERIREAPMDPVVLERELERMQLRFNRLHRYIAQIGLVGKMHDLLITREAK